MAETDDISLKQLRTLSIIMRERNLTRTAEILETSQSSISKTLARLRAHFGDPLFVRAGLHLEPTPKAIELMEPLRTLLSTSDSMRAATLPFDPERSTREFRLLVTDVGMLHFMPQLMERFAVEGPNLRLIALPFDSRQFELKLEGGEADIAIGDFPHSSSAMRRQKLFTDNALSVVRVGHPRLATLASRETFFSERHIIVASSTAGHAAHQIIERVLEAELEPDRIQLRLPSFVAGAAVAKRTDAVVTMPANLARFVAREFGLAVFVPPLPIADIEIAQFWHERMHNDRAHQWFRAIIYSLFKEKGEKRS